MRRLLLLSNSTQHGRGYLDHAADELVEFLGSVRRLLFAPFALHDRAGYTEKFRRRMAKLAIEVEELAVDGATGREQIARAEGIFVGGGNTFRLLRAMQDGGLLPALGDRVSAGMAYAGASAGINLACPTICTTNDMPIVEPRSFAALGLVPFQINPHYLDPAPDSTHMGETREQRLIEFLEDNDRIVVGLREGGWIRVEGDRGHLGGLRGARIFRRGAAPEERAPGAALDDLLGAG